MQYLIYVSTAVGSMQQDDLLEILKVSRKNNQQKNITGMLLYADGTFVQVLEGESEAIAETYRAIMADERHKGIIKVADGALYRRNFGEWAMGFKAANADELAEFEGFLTPSDKVLSETDIHPAVIVLKAFADGNRLSD
jgi:hypothetical protein